MSALREFFEYVRTTLAKTSAQSLPVDSEGKVAEVASLSLFPSPNHVVPAKFDKVIGPPPAALTLHSPHVDESPVAEATTLTALPVPSPSTAKTPRPTRRIRPIYHSLPMTAFVTSCVETVSGSAAAAERRARGRPRARRLLKLLDGKRNILVTTHQHPDPDALASGLAMCNLLGAKLKGAKVSMSINQDAVVFRLA